MQNFKVSHCGKARGHLGQGIKAFLSFVTLLGTVTGMGMWRQFDTTLSRSSAFLYVRLAHNRVIWFDLRGGRSARSMHPLRNAKLAVGMSSYTLLMISGPSLDLQQMVTEACARDGIWYHHTSIRG